MYKLGTIVLISEAAFIRSSPLLKKFISVGGSDIRSNSSV